MPRYQEYDDSSAPPPAAEEDDASKPLGVPEDYPIPGGAPGPMGIPDSSYWVTYGHAAPRSRYMEGDQWLPANYDATMVAALQAQLREAGLLTTSFTPGVFDPSTRDAYKQLLSLANAAGEDANHTLARLVANAGEIPQAAEPLVTQTTDPAVLRQVFRRGIIDLTGEGWSQEQINDMVSAYNQAEIARQKQAYDLEQSGESGNITAMPSPDAFIEDQLRSKHPEQVQEEEALGFLGDFLNMAGSGAWNG